MKNRMRIDQIRTPDDLFREAERAWDTITIEEVSNLIDSFVNRLRAIVILGGESLNGHKQLLRELDSNADPTDIATRFRNEVAQEQFFDRSASLFNVPWQYREWPILLYAVVV
jgi:hypothetical protein